MEKYQNGLIHESSPYLKQHAHNPVNWVAWSKAAFEQAKKENKLVLVSVGYSACHWCHVMEHESFEDEEVAAIMNKHFVCIKVDREERPDVDQVYMNAVQLMTQQGGWPLNCFTLPDGRPIYGGTYFPKEQWIHILKSLNYTAEKEPEKVEEYAAKLHEGVQLSELIERGAETDFDSSKLDELVLRWSKNFDANDGGNSRAPKFPLPSNIDFLLEHGSRNNDRRSLNHALLTLDKMALGGIYDQIGGGFARYSVDMLWKVPHFEKMLYDNGQLLHSYSMAFAITKNPMYQRVVAQTMRWMSREMSDDSGALNSALDADSEGVEGKFYVWQKEELEQQFKPKHWIFELFEFNHRSSWEGSTILLRASDDAEFAQRKSWTQEQFQSELSKVNQQLLDERSHRVRPGLDNKCLSSWNGMTLKGLCSAHRIFGDEESILLADKIAKWLRDTQISDEGLLFRNFANGHSSIDGFLEDYAHVIDGLIAYYQITFDESWLELAEKLNQTAIQFFLDKESGMFFFTPENTELIARKMEVNDNVLPASNSVMANNLLTLSYYYQKSEYREMSRQMLLNVYDGMEMYGSGYSNWARLLVRFFTHDEELCIFDRGSVNAVQNGLKNCPYPVLTSLWSKDSKLPIHLNHTESKGTVQVCSNGICHPPVSNLEEAFSIIIQSQLGKTS